MDARPTHDGKPTRALVALALLATGVTGYLLGSGRLRFDPVSKMPLTSGPPAFDPVSVQRVPQVNLAADTIDAFVRWVAATPGANVQDVRDAIAAARTDDAVVHALIANLFNLPTSDIGQHLLLLAIVGEMRQPAFSEPLVEFIGLAPGSIVGDVSNQHACGTSISHIDAAALLKARAVEMLAFLRTSEAFEAVLGFARYHESRVVRIAALDAYIYNHEDSPDAIERARATARRNEAKFVGLPRFTRDSNPAQFAEKMAAFYEQHPEERPPVPHFARGPTRQSPQPRPPQ
ncbi:hypothetical protein LJR289_004337 [Pseudoduganella sp. LjRoot289]|uniref:hypothetical protein n=1 Tax=Pseudoduganella sp. LjRoot289 TaxID=3342314 RepID=UPI003ED0487F